MRMNWTAIDRRKRLYIMAAIILLAGWSAALLIYLNPGEVGI